MGRWDKHFKNLPDDAPRSMGELLKMMRKETGRNQDEMAKRINRSRETLNAIENNKPGSTDKITLETLEAIHNACRPSMSQKVISFYSAVMKRIHRID